MDSPRTFHPLASSRHQPLSIPAMSLFAANAQDWISVIIPIVVAIIWVLNQVIGKLGQPQNQGPRRPVAQPQPRPQPKVEDEIEAFLRRAAQQRGGQAPRPSTPQPAAPRQLVPRGESVSSARRAAEGLVQVEMVDEEE